MIFTVPRKIVDAGRTRQRTRRKIAPVRGPVLDGRHLEILELILHYVINTNCCFGRPAMGHSKVILFQLGHED